LAGALPQTPLGELTALSRPSSWIIGGLLLRERRGEGKVKGERERESEEGERGVLDLPLQYMYMATLLLA